MNLYSPPFPLKGRPVKRLSSPLLPLPAVPSSDRSCICDILPQGKLCSAAFSTFYCSLFCRFLLACKKTQKTSSIGHPWVATRPYMCSSILPQNSYGQTIFSSKSSNSVDSWTLQKPLFAFFLLFFLIKIWLLKRAYLLEGALSCSCPIPIAGAAIMLRLFANISIPLIFCLFSTVELVCNYLDTDYFPLLLFCTKFILLSMIKNHFKRLNWNVLLRKNLNNLHAATRLPQVCW